MRIDFSLTARLRSFSYAFAGIWALLRTQHNAWIHGMASVCVLAAGLWLKVSRIEWCLLIFAMTTVWTAEAFNTALEFLADTVSPDVHPLIKKAKDVAAGAVLLTAIGAAVTGGLVFFPYLSDVFL